MYVGGASLIAKNKVLTVAHKFNVIQDVNNPVSSLLIFIQQRLEHKNLTPSFTIDLKRFNFQKTQL